MKPDEVPDQNQIFMQLFLYSPVLLEVLLHDKTFSQVISSNLSVKWGA